MVVVDHADELLQGLHSGGRRKNMNRSNFLLQGEDALGRDMMAQEIDLLSPEDTFVVVEDKTSGAETFEDQMKVTLVLFRSGEEDKDVIDVSDAEGEIAENGVYHPLKGGTSVTKAKTGVVEGVGAKGHGDGGLQDVVWIHGNLVVVLQEVQLGEYFRPMEIGGDVCDVGKRVVVWLCQHIKGIDNHRRGVRNRPS